MKKKWAALFVSGLLFFIQVRLVAQTDSTTKPKPYLVSMQTMAGQKEKGILFNVHSDTLVLLSYTNKYRPFLGPKMVIDESVQIKIMADQIRSFSLQRKGAMNSSVIIGFSAGAFVGGIIGGIAAGGSSGWLKGVSTINGVMTGVLVGGTVGGLIGYLIGKGKQKRFTIDGNKNTFLGLHDELMQKAYITQ